VIDLHTHTNASDGRLPPGDLVREAWKAGLRVLGITDHDTLGGLTAARAAAASFGLTLVEGVEVTAVEAARDVHVLGYFVNPDDARLSQFFTTQRGRRVDRIREIGVRLSTLGAPVNVEQLVTACGEREHAIGRPAVAAALVAAGYATNIGQAFDRYLSEGAPAWVPRTGPTVVEVLTVLHESGAVASLAHPVLYRADHRIAEWAAAGLDAIEVFHSDHDREAAARYQAMAAELGLAISGGSDYHGDGRVPLGGVTLPEAEFERLVERGRQRAAGGTS
jgi:predicted metal-dependent phosphoesterase TrpH